MISLCRECLEQIEPLTPVRQDAETCPCCGRKFHVLPLGELDKDDLNEAWVVRGLGRLIERMKKAIQFQESR